MCVEQAFNSPRGNMKACCIQVIAYTYIYIYFLTFLQM